MNIMTTKKKILITGFIFLGALIGNINNAIASDMKPGEKVLKIAQEMMEEKVIVKGSCWDYLHAAYNKAGYPIKDRETIFKGTQKSGPYANINTIEPGDWLYFVNYSYNKVGHSGMFVEWENKDKKIAKILSYAGENRKEPARYKNYDLKSVYNIMRPKDTLTGKIREPKTLKGEKCEKDLILSQNLKAPKSGYVRNGKYHWYTKSTVREADILQKHLNRLGFNAGPVDGIIGPLTKGAILRLQKYLETTPDGYVGPITRKLLNNSC